MKDTYLDARSPYIKNDINSIVKTKKNVLSVKTGEEREASDTLLRQKITNISRKIVGDEIKKFAEVASHEISEEFAVLEKRLEQNIQKSLYKSLGENIKESVTTFGYDIGRELDSKIRELTSLITEIDSKLENLEYYSKSLEERIEESIKEKNDNDNIYTGPIFKIETTIKDNQKIEDDTTSDDSIEINEEDLESVEEEEKEREEFIGVIENEILIPQNKNVESQDELIEELINEILKKNNIEDKQLKNKINFEKNTQKIESKVNNEEILEEAILLESDPEYTEKINYISERLGEILPKFEKKGFLFKKNTFTSTIKDLDTKDFLKNTEKIVQLNEKDKENIESILREINLNPKKGETIGNFLKRAYLKEYQANK